MTAVAWDPVWEQIFGSQAWGKYPGEDLIRFVARNFYSAADRSTVRILEVGSGTGANLWFIAREGFSPHGIEGSSTAASVAGKRLDTECPGWNRAPRMGTLTTGDMLRLPWPDAAFDAVIDSEAVYCNDFEESSCIYREMHRVTRPGGKLFVRTFATGTWGDGSGAHVGPRRYIADVGPLAGKGPSRFTTLDEIPALLGPWQVQDIELVTRSMNARQHTISEWIIEGIKA
jgi:SAM-dependent methyltransferase